MGTFSSSCLWILGAAARAAQDQLLTGLAKLSDGTGLGTGLGTAGRDGRRGRMVDEWMFGL